MSTTQHNTLRSSNFELLRIVSMFIIVTFHFAFHGGFSFGSNVTIPKLWIQFIQVGGRIGVNVFVLMSGYFLINAPKISVSKILRLWLQTFFYSVVIYLVLVFSGIRPFSTNEFIEMLSPITHNVWWFASTYFVLYFLSPYLNILLKNLDRETYLKLLFLLFVMWCLIPTFTTSDFQSNNLLWFMFLYSLAGYIKLWHDKSMFSCWVYHVIATVLVLFTAFVLGTRYYKKQKLPVLLVSVAMFLGFKGLKIKQNKFINIVATATFGVYLIHDNDYVREFLWINVFKNATYSDTIKIIPYSCAVITLVYVGCTLIELLRLKIIEPLYLPIIKKADIVWDRMLEAVKSKMSKMSKKN